jgi:hypothetical protein
LLLLPAHLDALCRLTILLLALLLQLLLLRVPLPMWLALLQTLLLLLPLQPTLMFFAGCPSSCLLGRCAVVMNAPVLLQSSSTTPGTARLSSCSMGTATKIQS